MHSVATTTQGDSRGAPLFCAMLELYKYAHMSSTGAAARFRQKKGVALIEGGLIKNEQQVLGERRDRVHKMIFVQKKQAAG